jgi:hypothetical protein
MRYPIAVLLALFATCHAPGQQLGVILLDARDEHTSCITDPVHAWADKECKNPTTVPLALGRTVRLMVFNRRFLTNYSLEIGEAKIATTRPLGGAVHSIRIEIGASPVVQPHSLIERKTARDFLGELLDVTSSSEARAEIEHESEILDQQLRKIRTDISAFNLKYALVVGDGADLDCKKSQRNGLWLEACLKYEFQQATNSHPLGDTDFRNLVIRADNLFRETRNLEIEFATADLVSAGRGIEESIFGYQNDVRSFKQNLNAAQEAVWVVKQLADSPGDPLLSLQIREQLRERLNAGSVTLGSSKPALDVAETNEQIDRYFKLLSDRNSIPQVSQKELGDQITEFKRTDRASQSLDTAVQAIDDKVTAKLPRLISQINDWQRRLAARINEIYQDSQMPVTQSDSALNLVPSSGIVSYRIVRTSEFEPYIFMSEGTDFQPSGVEVSRGAFAVTENPPQQPKRTVWQILRLAH